MFDSKEDTLWQALDQYVMSLDEDLGYDIPREELKTAVINFVENYFNDSATAAEYAAEEERPRPSGVRGDIFTDERR